MKSGFAKWLTRDKSQSRAQKKYYSQITRKAISLVLVADLILVSVFSFAVYTPNTKAEEAVVIASYDWYTAAGGPAGGAEGSPYVIQDAGDLLGLTLMLKKGGYPSSDTPKTLELLEDIVSDGAVEEIPPEGETTGGGMEGGEDIKPIEPPIEPTDSVVPPIDPPTEPTDPVIPPTEPTNPVDPPTEPIDPPTEPTKPVDPPTELANPEPSSPEPTPPTGATTEESKPVAFSHIENKYDFVRPIGGLIGDASGKVPATSGEQTDGAAGGVKPGDTGGEATGGTVESGSDSEGGTQTPPPTTEGEGMAPGGGTETNPGQGGENPDPDSGGGTIPEGGGEPDIDTGETPGGDAGGQVETPTGGAVDNTTDGAIGSGEAIQLPDLSLLDLGLMAEVALTTDSAINSGFSGKYFVISGQIDLSSFNGQFKLAHGKDKDTIMWTPIGTKERPFNGHMTAAPGSGITGLCYANDFEDTDGTPIKKDFDYFGLFGYVGKDGVVDGLVFTGTNFFVTDDRMNRPAVSDMLVSSMGVVAAFNHGVIKNCRVSAQDYAVSGGGIAAGIELPNTESLPVASATSRVGGISGYNGGLIANTMFLGTIHSAGETKAVFPYNQGGIGGIAGETEGTGVAITNCIVNGSITFANAGQVGDINNADKGAGYDTYVGGISGVVKSPNKTSSVKIENCVFNGTIKGNNKGAYSHVGGIAGYLTSAIIDKCAAAMDLQWSGGVDDARGGTGGIAGNVSTGAGGTVQNSFVMGNIYGEHNLGGIAGSGISVENSYCTAAVKTVNFTYQTFCGGISGKGASVNNSYFAGTTLTPHTGSIFGQGNTGTRIFYDATISPNSPATDVNGKTYLGMNKTTEELCSADFPGLSGSVSAGGISADAVWSLEGGRYPQLAWTQTVTSGAIVDIGGTSVGSIAISDEYVSVVKNLSRLSTETWGSVNAGNSYGNAYQMQSSFQGIQTPMSVSGIPEATSDFQQEPIADVYGNFAGNKVGYVSKNTAIFPVNGITYGAVTTRKTLYAPKASTSTAITTEGEFYTFLGYWQAGGSVLGSSFTVSADAISLTTPIKRLTDYGRGTFAGTMDGQNCTISAVTFTQGSRSLLGNGIGGAAKNLNFEAVSVGALGGQIQVDETCFGLLFGETGFMNISNVNVENYGFYIKGVNQSAAYGGIAGLDYGGSLIDSVRIDGLSAVIGDYAASGKRDENTLRSFGAVAGKVSGTIENCKVAGLDLKIDIYEGTGNTDGAGGIAGSDVGVISKCSVEGSIKAQQADTGKSLNIGGIAGFLSNSKNINGSHYIGHLVGVCAGGIAGYTNYGASVSNSYFAGSIASGNQASSSNKDTLGGIVGYQSSGLSIQNSFAFANIRSNHYGGGLIGSSMETATIDNSYSSGTFSGELGVGGLIGRKSSNKNVTTNNVYFLGQVIGAGSKGGFVGASPNDYVLTAAKAMYDKQITGRLKSVGGNKDSANLGVLGSSITADALNSGTFVDMAAHYPQLRVFAAQNQDPTTKLISEVSTRKVFSLDADADNEYLQGIKFSKITVSEATDGALGYTLNVTPAALYYVEGNTKTEMMVRAPGSDSYEIVPDNMLTEEGSLTVEYKLTDIVDISMPYRAGIKAFDYGDGTEANPYIIYNESVFQDFAKFVSRGRDSQSTNYIIAQVLNPDTDPKPGGAITLDMETYPFEAIKGLSGTLLGNNSTIKNVTLSTMTQTVAGYTTAYQGIFGTTDGTAVIKDLTIRDVKQGTAPSANAGYIGVLVGQAKGGTFENISVDAGSALTIPMGFTTAFGGGLIGCVDGTGNLITNIGNVTTIVDIKGTAGREQGGGGLIGYLVDSKTRIDNSAAYGSIGEVKTAGGLVGKINNEKKGIGEGLDIQNAVSLVDINYSGSDGKIGGLIGQSMVPKKNSGNIGGNSVGLNLTIRDSYQGGTLLAQSGSRVGGLIGQLGLVIETGKTKVEPDYPAGHSFSAADISGPSADSQIAVFMAASMSGNKYRRDQNPYDAMGLDMYAHYTYWSEARNGYLPYASPVLPITEGKSSTWALTSGHAPSDSWLPVDWIFEKGVFPILKGDTGVTPEAIKVADKVKFHSIALFMTRAGKIGERKYQNAYITYSDAVSSAVLTSSGAAMRFTSNGAMAVATGENATETVTLNWKGFSRNISFTASTEASGIPDFSWYVINPQGMWSYGPKTTVTTDTDAGGNVTTHTAIDATNGWGLYTADQLQGLSLLNQASVAAEPVTGRAKLPLLADALIGIDQYGQIQKSVALAEAVESLAAKEENTVSDGNGVTIEKGRFTVPEDKYDTETGADQTTVKGQLWRILLGKDMSLSAYKPFTPIGNTEIPFTYKFSGDGFILSDLNLTTSTGGILLNVSGAAVEAVTGGGIAQPAGLFGTVSGGKIEKLGIMSGNAAISGAKAPVGTLAGKMTDGAALENCFSGMGLFGDDVNTHVGGLVGEADGTGGRVEIKDSFYTGAVQLTSENSFAGGLAGKGKDTDFSRSYVAGYVDGATYGAIAGEAVSGNNSYQNCFDKNASGNLSGAGRGENLATTANSTDEMIAYDKWGDGWTPTDNYYPIQDCFTVDRTSGPGVTVTEGRDGLKAAVVPTEFTPTARSASEGRILHLPASDLTVTTKAITWNVGKGEPTVTQDALGYYHFGMKNSGMVWTKVGLNGQSRDVLFNLRCWYDEGTVIDGKLTYRISAASELAELAAIVNGTVNISNPNGLHKHKKSTDGVYADGYSDNFANATILLEDDIDLSSIADWTSIGTDVPLGADGNHRFKGTFDGQEHVIFNLTQTTATDNKSGLFGSIESPAIIKNTGLQGGRIAGGLTIGGIVAAAHGSAIDNCFASIQINNPAASAVGGIAGHLIGGNSRVENCFSMSQLTGGLLVGGIAGYSEGLISRSYNTGIAIAGGGGIASGIGGEATGRIEDCFAAGYIHGENGSYGIAKAESTEKIQNSWYDKQMADIVLDGGGRLTAAVAPEGYYQVPTGTAIGNSELFRTARQLSVLALDFGADTYSDFSAGTANRVLSAPESKEVRMTLEKNLFNCVPAENVYVVTNLASEGGSDILMAAADGQSGQQPLTITKPYYLFTKATIELRYNFIFTEELVNMLSGSAISPGTEANVTEISTMAQLNAIDWNNTEGKIYRLTRNISAAGIPLAAPIGTKERPFMGTFDGNGYAISDLTIKSAGDAGFFGYIGFAGKVKNLLLSNLSVEAEKPVTGNLYMGAIAAHNAGSMVNVGAVGKVKAINSGFAGDSYIGGLLGENSGRVEGCYFIGTGGITHSSRSADYAGGLIGFNRGNISGCFVSSNMANLNIKGLFGTTIGTFKNCYYNCGVGNNSADELRITYAYNSVDKTSEEGVKRFVRYDDMKKSSFAQMLSSSLYGGTYYIKANQAYPELYSFELMRKDMGDLAVMLSVRNILEAEGGSPGGATASKSTFMNAIGFYKSFDFPYFSNISFKKELQAEMSALNKKISYSMDATVYGKGAGYEDIDKNNYSMVQDISMSKRGTAYNLSAADLTQVTKPQTIMLNVTLASQDFTWPWGVYRTDAEGGIK